MPKKKKKEEGHPKPRFKQPFFRNYDLVDDPTGPGAGFFSHMHEYDSIADFRKKKKKRNKKISERRVKLLALAFDFPLEHQVTPIIGDDSFSFFGGLGDKYFETHDFEGKTPDNLDYARPENFDEFVEKLDDNQFIGILSHLINNHSDFLGFPGNDLDSPDIKSNNRYDLLNENVPSHSVVFE